MAVLAPGKWTKVPASLEGLSVPDDVRARLRLFGIRQETAHAYRMFQQQADAQYRSEAAKWRAKGKKTAARPSAKTATLYACLQAFACGVLTEAGYPSHLPIGFEDERQAFIVVEPMPAVVDRETASPRSATPSRQMRAA